MKYTTKQGDVLDLICYRHYPNQDLSPIITAVLDANQGLCKYKNVLPQGLTIELPDIQPVTAVKETINLWN